MEGKLINVIFILAAIFIAILICDVVITGSLEPRKDSEEEIIRALDSINSTIEAQNARLRLQIAKNDSVAAEIEAQNARMLEILSGK